MFSVISSCYRAVGGLSGYRVPPPPSHHHSTGEGLWTCAQCCQVSQTDVAMVHSFQSAEVMCRMVNIYPLFHFWLSHNINCSASNRPWIKDRFMSPDIEAVHRLLIDQKASVKSHRGSSVIPISGCKMCPMAANSRQIGHLKWHVYIFYLGVECGQTIYWQVSVRVHPRVPSRLSYCLLSGLSSITEEACSPWVKGCWNYCSFTITKMTNIFYWHFCGFQWKPTWIFDWRCNVVFTTVN